ncbi:MAG: hypothetical protein KKB31_06420 [Nanoarchaeota archaeon]|nr:hypothetical protein [Nanoarchaeota archaeon]
MCIDRGKGVKIASKDIKVYKVLINNGSTIFRNEKAYELHFSKIGKYSEDFDNIIKNKAIGFDKGFGFTVFKSKKIALLYKDRVAMYNFLPDLIIEEYKIPKGSRYESGKIQHGYIGSSLTTIRCEELIK